VLWQVVLITGFVGNNSFTPWFKLIARDFLFGWWDELLARKQNGVVNAKSLEGVVDGSKVVKMV
jgi:isopentenyl-diphosphate delta-isomerase